MSRNFSLDPQTCRRIAASCAFFRLTRAARVAGRRIDGEFEEEEISPNQLLILVGLSLGGGARIRDLAGHLGLDYSTLSRTLNPLLKRGWIRDADGPDRRASPLELTELGRRHAQKAVKSWERFQSGLERALGAERLKRLGDDLDALIALEAPEKKGPKRALKSKSARAA